MKKLMYILETLLVMLMVIYFIRNVFISGFSSEEFLILAMAILLATTFYESYKKDKIIAKLQKNSKLELIC